MSGSDVARVILMYIDATKWHLTLKMNKLEVSEVIVLDLKIFPLQSNI